MGRATRVAAAVATAVVALVAAAPIAAAAGSGDHAQLERWARDTWRSFEAMTDPDSGLPADILEADGSTSVQTSTTNIGAYLWSTYAAQRLGFIGRREMRERMARTLTTLEGMERHAPSGQFFNWYDHHSGEKLTSWPPTGEPLTPILSSVDNAWLAAGLRIVRFGVPALSARAGALYDSMDFGFYYRPDVNRVLFHFVPDTGEAVCCYDTLVSESRMVDYLGIAAGRLPAKEYFGRWRTFPDTCEFSFQETKPVGAWRTYEGVEVFEGAYPYAGFRLVPSWGGSMFEALMPDLFVPEERWAPRSWGVNHPLTVRAQIHHGLEEAGYGFWGFSPSNVPEGGYAAYGVDGAGMDPNGYPSDEQGTLVDAGFAGCPDREPQPAPEPEDYGDGVVTPHASFLALRYAPREAVRNLRALAASFPGSYGRWGFRDSVNVGTGTPSGSYLSLDQGMVMAALANALEDDLLRRTFARGGLRRAIAPVIGQEAFNASPAG
jgi:hypothetical protein